MINVGDSMEKSNPMGIKFIGWFQVFGALAVLFTLGVQQSPPFNERFAVPFIPEIIVKILLVVVSIIISYGYLKRTKWGYWSMLIYSILFCFISIIQGINYNSQPFIGNVFYSGIVAVYTLVHFKYFT